MGVHRRMPNFTELGPEIPQASVEPDKGSVLESGRPKGTMLGNGMKKDMLKTPVVTNW